MSSPRAFLVDDEPLALERLHRMLVETGRVEVVGQSTDPALALETIIRLRPDAILLDIDMPGIDGFELVSRLDYEPTLVFTTAYDQYALKAFEVNSVDYLLKPIEPEDLDRALTRLERRHREESEGSASLERIRAVLDEIISARGGGSPLQRIASRVGQRVRFIDLLRVSHFTADDKLTYAVTDEGTHVVDMTLGDLERTLPASRFQRIHRAALVNLEYVSELYGSSGAAFRVRLKDSQQSDLKVARDRVQSLKEKLGIAARSGERSG